MQMRFRANAFGQKFLGKKVSGKSLFSWVDSGEWVGIPQEWSYRARNIAMFEIV